ncbi:MAG TPA: EAL domain-containing protein [Pyrinomonadaceae bacterium]|nr:EAL domain-containing protein [Pyrinomonadaceae bacterium]
MMAKYRFPRQLMQVVSVLGAGAALFSLYLCSVAQLGAPFLLVLLLAFVISSRYSITMPRGRGKISILNIFVVLAMLLFGGNAAVLFAAATALCLSLSKGKDRLIISFEASVSAVSAFIVVWTIRLNFGMVTEPGYTFFSYNFLKALAVIALVQAILSTSLTVFNEAYLINQSSWRKWGVISFWTVLANLTGAVIAALGSSLIIAAGNTALMVAALLTAIGMITYLSHRKNTQIEEPPAEHYGANLRDTSDRFRSAFDNASIGMALVTPEGRWLQVNQSLCQLLGYSQRELMSMDYLDVLHPNDLSPSLASFKDLLRGRIPSCQMEKRYLSKSGEEVWGLWSASLAKDALTKTPNLIFQIQDISDRKRAEETLHHDAFHDRLTGLPNRALFMDHLKLAIARLQRRDDQMFAVLYIDLDRFKVVNDSLGHMVGDELLIGIARRLESCLRPGDTIARLGGDEFTVLLEDIGDGSVITPIAERIQQELSSPFSLSGREVFTTVSMGIAISSKEYGRPEDILRDADTAMYRAKSMGKARHETFDTQMHSQAIKLLQLETDLRRALEREEFLVAYQPIMSLETGALRGFEALIRWHHPEHGLVSPMDFIPVAEETGMIVQIGEWVLSEACQQMRKWQLIFPSDPPIFMSVNLSVRQFSQLDLIEKVVSILDETKLAPTSLKLEITESAVMENVENAINMLNQLRALGVQLAMDDFGTGYSSLSYLHRFPINTLKIDRSFITRMAENNENAEIVRTISGLAQNLGMDVVAEGVETSEQLEILKGLGCQYGQGYFFSKPLDALSAEAFSHKTYLPSVQVLEFMTEAA